MGLLTEQIVTDADLSKVRERTPEAIMAFVEQRLATTNKNIQDYLKVYRERMGGVPQ